MLRLVCGRGKTGKSSMIMEEIHDKVRQKQGRSVLVVPDQYSYEVERELLRICGDTMNLYAQVTTFPRLCLEVEEELGSPPATTLDPGGRLLCMTLALQNVQDHLHIYGASRADASLQAAFLNLVKHCKTACVTYEDLTGYAATHAGLLGEKLHDLALVSGAYEAILAQGYFDPQDRLTRLTNTLAQSHLVHDTFYFDAFTEFSLQEQSVIGAMLAAGCDVTVCLTCDGLTPDLEVFESSRKAAVSLLHLAKESATPSQVLTIAPDRPPTPMLTLERHLFNLTDLHLPDPGCFTLRTATSMAEECGAAAAQCIALVRDTGCRYQDIAIAVRGFEDYRRLLESTFAHYGVPIYAAERRPMEDRPLYTLIASAYDVVTGNFALEDVLTYLRTGLAGLSIEETDTLETYLFTWSIHGKDWQREWGMHPDGFRDLQGFTERTKQTLEHINALRLRVAEPLFAFQNAALATESASAQVDALYKLFDDLQLMQTLEQRAAHLEELGLARIAAETVQLWDLTVSALEQCRSILEQAPVPMDVFGKLFCQLLQQYDIGTIPLGLDSITAGDMDRMRRRHIQHLIILGASADRLPSVQRPPALLSAEDLEALDSAGIHLGRNSDDLLYYEFSTIYNCVILPSHTLTLSWCNTTSDGAAAVPSFLALRLQSLFSLTPQPIDIQACRLAAPKPAFELAASVLDLFHNGIAGAGAGDISGQPDGDRSNNGTAGAAANKISGQPDGKNAEREIMAGPAAGNIPAPPDKGSSDSEIEHTPAAAVMRQPSVRPAPELATTPTHPRPIFHPRAKAKAAPTAFATQAVQVNPDPSPDPAPAPAPDKPSLWLPTGTDPAQAAAATCFWEMAPDALQKLYTATHMPRGQLSPDSVTALYGEQLRLSASRIDTFASCQFSYFLRYGLRTKERVKADFAPPEIGTFTHYVLEHVAREITQAGGFATVQESVVRELTDKYISAYTHDYLADLEGRSARFIHLFERVADTVRKVVLDMVHELAISDFVPLDFELNFGDSTGLPPVTLGVGASEMTLTGIADRVDGCKIGDTLWLRITDYKTGQHTFSLSDVLQGKDLQMLLYLFVLQAQGAERYGAHVAPAGILYVPARVPLISSTQELPSELVQAEREKALRRSGLLLADNAVLHAMEHSDSPVYIPAKIKNGTYCGDSLATAEQLSMLEAYIRRHLGQMAENLHNGCIDANPLYKSEMDNACVFCPVQTACHFQDGLDRRRLQTRLRNSQVWGLLEKQEQELAENNLGESNLNPEGV